MKKKNKHWITWWNGDIVQHSFIIECALVIFFCAKFIFVHLLSIWPGDDSSMSVEIVSCKIEI